MRWHHQLNGDELEQTPGDGEGQGSLVCCCPWGHKELESTERLNNNNEHVYECGYVTEWGWTMYRCEHGRVCVCVYEAWENCREGGREGGGQHIQEFLQQGAGTWEHQMITVKENQMSQIKEFNAFLYTERCKSLGSLQSFLWYAPQLSEASILCVHILSFLRAPCRQWLQSDGC